MVYRSFRWLNTTNIIPFRNVKGKKVQSNTSKEVCKVISFPKNKQETDLVLQSKSVLGILLIILSCIFLGPGVIIK